EGARGKFSYRTIAGPARHQLANLFQIEIDNGRPSCLDYGWMQFAQAPDLAPVPPQFRAPRRMLPAFRSRGLYMQLRRNALGRALHLEKARAPVAVLRIHCGHNVRALIRRTGARFVNLPADFKYPKG